MGVSVGSSGASGGGGATATQAATSSAAPTKTRGTLRELGARRAAEAFECGQREALESSQREALMNQMQVQTYARTRAASGAAGAARDCAPRWSAPTRR